MFTRTKLIVALATASVVVSFSDARAQLTPSSEPQTQQRQFEDSKTATRTGGPEVQQTTGGRSARADDGKSFTLRNVVFEGATVYDSTQLSAVFSDLIGKNITLGEARAAANRVTSKYRADGYLLSSADVPAQNLSGGTLKVRVTEGYIESITIEGKHEEKTDVRNLILNYGEKIKQERPLKAETLERYLLLADDLPGVTAKGLVRRGSSAAGSNLVILLDHKMWEASLATDNRGTKFIGRPRHTATATANSIFGLYDRTLFRTITASPTDELIFWDIQHEQQLNSEGAKLILIGSHVQTKPGDTLKPLEIKGTSDFLRAQVRSPFIRSRQENLTGRATLDYRNSNTQSLNVELNEDRIRAARVGVAYDYADSYQGVTFMDFEVSQGLDVINSTDFDDPGTRSRVDGRNTFTKFNFDISRDQVVPWWNGVSLFASASGQYSLDPLLSAEEFALGGVGFGQAYDVAELTGDHGAAAKLELRYADAPGWEWLNSYQFYTYYDIGKVWQDSAPTGVESSNSLASVGFGVRTNFTDWLAGTAELAFPLTRDVAAEGDDDTRFFYSFTGRF